MLVAFRKSTGGVIKDFQDKATSEVLVSNAVKTGIPRADIEVRDISAAEAKALEDVAFAEARADAETDRERRQAAATALMKRLGMAEDDLQALRDLVSG